MVSHVHIIPYTYADYNTLSGHYPCALNTGIPAMTLNNVWQICYKVAGWDMFAQIPLVSTAQNLTVTSAAIFLNGAWQALTIKRTLAYGGYLRAEFQEISSLAYGLYLCRITGKLEK